MTEFLRLSREVQQASLAETMLFAVEGRAAEWDAARARLDAAKAAFDAHASAMRARVAA
jgi:hypothetical protein